MKIFLKHKQLIVVFVLLVAELALVIFNHQYTNQLDSQSLAKRWAPKERYMQVSCFLPESAGGNEEQFLYNDAKLHTALSNASVDETEGGRKFLSAYSCKQGLTVSNGTKNAEVVAYGVSKDFFLFHPIELISGRYFTNTDEANDGVILDEKTAWTLFGATDVAGMTMQIGERSYEVIGVVREEEKAFSKASGENETAVYVDYAVLTEQLGEAPAITCYEVLMPNPVKNFAKDAVVTALEMEENKYELVENSKRFRLGQRFARLKQIGIRSMSIKGIVFPYWENRARGFEDVTTILLIPQILLLLYPVAYGIHWLVMLIMMITVKIKTRRLKK